MNKLFADADKIQKEVGEKIKNAGTPILSIDKIKGTYNDKWFGKVTLAIKGNNLWFNSEKSFLLHGPVQYYGDNTYVVKFAERSFDADSFLKFSLNDKGEVVGMKMEAYSPLTDFSFDFQDLDFVKIK